MFKRKFDLNLDKLYAYSIPAQEIIALYFNLRPLVRIAVNEPQLRILKEVSLKLRLKIAITNLFYYPNRNHPICLISKRKKELNEYYNLELNKSSPGILGKFLGYPDCCVNEYVKTREGHRPIETLLKTSNEPSFLLNYLYNFESRNFNHRRFNKISSNYHLSQFYLIPHIPCSFACRASIQYASKLLKMIKSLFPSYHKTLIYHLRRPILFYNDFTFFPINSKRITGNNLLVYDNFIKIHDFLPKQVLSLLKKGNAIKIKNDSIKIYFNYSFLGKLPNKVKLFNFV